jgi:hypothetical protein
MIFVIKTSKSLHTQKEDLVSLFSIHKENGYIYQANLVSFRHLMSLLIEFTIPNHHHTAHLLKHLLYLNLVYL